MESGKQLASRTGGKEMKSTVSRKETPKSRSLDWKSFKESSRDTKSNHKPSMIPVIKYGKIEPKQKFISQRESRSSSKLCYPSKPNQQKQKYIEEEKSIAEYYLKIDDIIQKFVNRKGIKEKNKHTKYKTQQNSTARKMTSDPLVFSKPIEINHDTLLEFQNSVQQITDIWLKTAADLSNTIKILKSNPRLDPLEFEVENMRIQVAINQAKSLTLLKTRNIITEARKLFKSRELLRVELENYLSDENLKVGLETNNSKRMDSQPKCKNGTGDSLLEIETLENNKEFIENDVNETKERKNKVEEDVEKADGEHVNENSTIHKSEKCTQFCDSISVSSDTDVWARELNKKSETITNLNKKIFELQKLCHERSLQCTQLEVKIAEFHDKIQWNQVLWKQIGKLKLQIKGLQQNNKQLELQKKELELKIAKLDQELDRLLKLNHLLNQKKYLLEAKQYNEQNKATDELKSGGDERFFSEKQNAINQLKTILSVMRDQESFAQKQISVFQSKIEELERNTKG